MFRASFTTLGLETEDEQGKIQLVEKSLWWGKEKLEYNDFHGQSSMASYAML